MKKLTLEQAWIECLKMCRWIVRERKRRPSVPIYALKIEYLEAKIPGYNEGDMWIDCYFCHYDNQRQREPDYSPCPLCPGKKVDKTFDCMHNEYDFQDEPAAFLRKIEALYKIYKGKNRKKAKK